MVMTVTTEMAASFNMDLKASSDALLYHGEFDPGSERTLAARFKHASRTAREKLAFPLEWRTGE